MAFLGANIMQSFKPGATGAEVGIHIGKSVGLFFLSLFGIVFVVLAFIVLC